jgi:hypothetical protein
MSYELFLECYSAYLTRCNTGYRLYQNYEHFLSVHNESKVSWVFETLEFTLKEINFQIDHLTYHLKKDKKSLQTLVTGFTTATPLNFQPDLALGADLTFDIMKKHVDDGIKLLDATEMEQANKCNYYNPDHYIQQCDDTGTVRKQIKYLVHWIDCRIYELFLASFHTSYRWSSSYESLTLKYMDKFRWIAQEWYIYTQFSSQDAVKNSFTMENQMYEKNYGKKFKSTFLENPALLADVDLVKVTLKSLKKNPHKHKNDCC